MHTYSLRVVLYFGHWSELYHCNALDTCEIGASVIPWNEIMMREWPYIDSNPWIPLGPCDFPRA